MTRHDNAAATMPVQVASRLTFGWALRRAMLGILILVVMFGGGAWLLYSTIEPDRADASETARSDTVAPARSADLR